MVGGAVLNQDYADMIGADFYGKRCHAVRTLCAEIFWHGGVGTARQIQKVEIVCENAKKFGKFFCICYNMHKSRRKENDSMGGMTRWHFFQH